MRLWGVGRLFAAGLLLAGAVVCAWGQVVGAAVSGTVRDETGAAIAGASITVHSRETGAERKLVGDDAGQYGVLSIGVGRYEVKAAKDGFASQVKTGIVLQVGQSATVDLTLKVGGMRQEVTVTEAPCRSA